ncbi:MAG: oligosaccharide flippase family protein [Bacteroidetes bacterium]|nr:oligosaccharide flippase family protein [Bacteroidota bacterium]
MMANDEGIGSKALRGSFWVVALEISNQLLQFVKTFYAARLLTPGDFGIVGFAFLVITFIDVISTTGMREAIIQRKAESQSYLSTVWLIEVGKGLVILILSLLLAHPISGWIRTANPDLTEHVIQLIGIIYFVQCTTNIGVIYFEKEIVFHRFFVYQFSGTITDVIATLVLVFLFRNVWALFFGILAGHFTRVLFSFLLIKYRPGFEFSVEKALELFHYGKWIFRSRIFTFLGLQLDSIVVSSFLGLYSLGIYQMAFRIGNLPVTQIANIMGKVIFPMFSKVQDEKSKLKEYFLMGMNLLSTWMAPIIILVFCFIPEFTSIFLKDKWNGIIPVVRILIIGGYIRIFATILDYFFSSVGTPKVSANMQFFRTAFFGAFVGPLAYLWGITGVAFSGLLSIGIVTAMYLPKAGKYLNISLTELNRDLFANVFYGIIFTVAVMAAKNYVYMDGLMSFSLMVTATLLAYISIGLTLGRITNFSLFQRTIMVIKSITAK